MSEPPPNEAEPRDDVVMLLGRTDEGHLHGVRRRGEDVALAELRPLQEGQSLHHGEVVSLKTRAGSPLLWDVEVHYTAPAVEAARKGPPKVATAAYRRGWDAIFGKVTQDDLN